jgi:hypothetical protein
LSQKTSIACTTSNYEAKKMSNYEAKKIKLTLGNTVEHFSAGSSQCTGTPMATVPASDADTPVASAIFPTRMVLPTLLKFGEKAIFRSPQYVDIPHVIEAVSEVDERNMIDQLSRSSMPAS